MAKKIKFYGVFAVNLFDLSKLGKTWLDVFNLPKLPKIQIKVFVFDNELAQVDCLSNIECTTAIAIDATSVDEFVKEVYKLKEEYSKSKEDEEESGDDCEEEQPTNEQKEPLCNVILTDVTISETIPTVKAIKEALNIGLKEAKDLVGAARDSPSILVEKISKLEADRIARFITSRCNCRIAVTKLN